MSGNPIPAVITVVTIGIVALVGVAIFGSLGTVALDIGVSEGSAVINPQTGQESILDSSVDETPSYWSISLTQGHGVDVDDESYVDASMPSDWDNGSWTVCSVGELREGVDENVTRSLVAVDNETLRIDYSDGEWSAIYVENASSSATATISSESPTSLTPACAIYDQSSDELKLHVDGDTSDPVPMDSNTEQRDLANNWNGTVDQTRVFDQPLDNATLLAFSSEPAAGLGVEDTARWMFEEGEGGTTSAYYHNDTATLVNAQWTTGVRSPELVQDEDYSVGVDPLTVTPLSGGLIDASPVLYVSWDTGLGGSFQTLLEGINNAYTLIPVVMLALMATVILGIVARLQS